MAADHSWTADHRLRTAELWEVEGGGDNVAENLAHMRICMSSGVMKLVRYVYR